jgi:hypothetical protein
MKSKKIKSFTATIASCKLLDGAITVGLADNEFDPSHYVLLQRTLEPDKQDQQLGLDGIYIESDSQSCSAYNGVKNITIAESQLRIEIDERYSQQLGAEVIEVYLSISSDEHSMLVDKLKDLVGNKSIFQVQEMGG